METSAIHIGPFLAEMDKGIRTSDAGENQMEQTQEKSDHQRRSCVVDETAPRNSWLLGRVAKPLPGSKGLVRLVSVKPKTNTLQRAAGILRLLMKEEDQG